jgi:hypothetical protein
LEYPAALLPLALDSMKKDKRKLPMNRYATICRTPFGTRVFFLLTFSFNVEPECCQELNIFTIGGNRCSATKR